ncbi:MAG: hypothetical protein AAF390_19285 [Pseudomonadota bacterium]
MRHIYTDKPRSRLLDRLALLSMLTLVGAVTVDLIVYKDIAGLSPIETTTLD